MPVSKSEDYKLVIPPDITLTLVIYISTLSLPPSHSMDKIIAGFGMLSTYTDFLRPTLLSVFVLSIPFTFNFVATWLFYNTSNLRKKAVKNPPTIPHWIPYIGSSLDLAFNALNFVKSSTYVQIIPLPKSQCSAYIHELISDQKATRKAGTLPRCLAESQRLFRARP